MYIVALSKLKDKAQKQKGDDSHLQRRHALIRF